MTIDLNVPVNVFSFFTKRFLGALPSPESLPASAGVEQRQVEATHKAG